MKKSIALILLVSLIAVSWAAEAIIISSSSQLLSGDNAQGVVGDYLLKNDSVSIIISDIPNKFNPATSGGNIIDAAFNSGLDDFELMYLYLNKDWPRQATYNSISIISSGTPNDSAHIRVSGVDSDNSDISIITDYILYNGTPMVKVISRFTNNSSSTISSFGIGDAFSWGSAPFVPGDADSTNWIASRTHNTVYGYTSPNRFAAIHGSYWSDATLDEVTIATGEQVLLEHYFMVGSDLQDIYTLYMNSMSITPGTVSGNVMTNGSPANEALVMFIKGNESAASYETLTNANGNYTADIEPGNWICRTTYLGQSQVENIQVLPSSETIQDFVFGNIEPVSMGNDTLTVIQSPLINIPHFVLPGDTFQVKILLPQSEVVTSASLSINGHNTEINYTELALASPFGLRTIQAILPDNMLFGLYDLKLKFTGQDSLDISEQSVCVIPEYKSDFTFIQVTDTHLPSHYFWDNLDLLINDSTEIEDFRAVIDDINIINPDFVIHTGDFINDGEVESLGVPSYSRAKKQLHELDVPLFLVAGNHDLGGWDATPAPDGTSRRTWWKYFGWKYLSSTNPTATITQDYSFDYGTAHFVGLEAYINYDEWRDNLYGDESFISSQLQWLSNDLANHSSAGLKVLFYHMDFKNELNLSSLGVDAAFWGHVHGNNEDSIHPYDISTGATCDGGRWYRVIRVINNNIVFNQAVQAGNYGQNLMISSVNEHTVRITNAHPFALNDCLLTFEIENGMEFTSFINATLFQIDSMAVPNIAYALADVPANGHIDVSIQTDSVTTSVETTYPHDHFLMNIYPNPFNPKLAINYKLSSLSDLDINVYDIQGRHVKTLFKGQQNSGDHDLLWNAADQPSGLYFIKANIKNASGQFQSVEKCLLMK